MDIDAGVLRKLLLKLTDLLFFEKGKVEDVLVVLKGTKNQKKVFEFFRVLLKVSAIGNFSVNELMRYLSKKIKSSTVLNTMKNFWIKNHKRIHSQIKKKSSFGNSLTGIKWRIDQLSNTNDFKNSDSVAIVEMMKKNNERVVFEVDKKGVNEVMSHFNQINRIIEKY